MDKQEFRQISRTGKTRVWTIRVEGKFIYTSYGELGGAMQHVVDEGQRKNVGRSNEVSPEEDAIYLAERAILKKRRNGYRLLGEEAAADIDWDGPLPENFRFYKPDNSLSKTLEKKINDNTALLTRKRDGEMMVLVKWADGSASILSRTMLPHHHLEEGDYTWNDRFPDLIEEIEDDDRIPPCSMFLGDVVADPTDRERWEVASFMKSKTEEALEMPPLFFYCWDVAFWDEEDLISTVPVGERYDIIHEVWGKKWDSASWVLPIEIYAPDEVFRFVTGVLQPRSTANKSFSNVNAAMEFAKNANWEGWVVVDPEAVMGDKAYNFRGKTDRPGKASGKLKPVFEGDFVAYFDPENSQANFPHGKRGKWGRGKYRGMVGAVSLYQYDSEGSLVYICECGGGIDDEFRANYSDPADYPIVVEVEYTERTFKSEGDKTNALTYPRLSRVRHDKAPDECVEEKL